MILDSIQQISVKFTYDNKQFIISLVYARCSALERLKLWDELQSWGQTVICLGLSEEILM